GVVADALRGLGERPRRARVDHQVDALARQRQRAAVTEPLAGAADERPFSGYAEIHRRTPRERESAMLPRARGSAPSAAAQQGAEHATDDLAAERRADRSRGALGHRLD